MDNKNEQLGATGKFPDGKLNDDDEGELRLMISKKGDNVHIDFGKPVAWMAFTKEDAIALGLSLIKHGRLVQTMDLTKEGE